MARYQRWTSLEETLAIDGIWVPELITAWENGDDDLSNDDSGRTLDGVMHKNCVDDKEYYSFTLTGLTWEQHAHLTSLLRNRNSVQFTYPNPFDPGHIGYLTTKEFYVQARESSTRKIFIKDGSPTMMFDDLKFKLAEI